LHHVTVFTDAFVLERHAHGAADLLMQLLEPERETRSVRRWDSGYLVYRHPAPGVKHLCDE